MDILLFSMVNFCGYINFKVMWILFCFTYCVNTKYLIGVILVLVDLKKKFKLLIV